MLWSLAVADESLPYPTRPMSNYTATKALAEHHVLSANSAELRTLSLRRHLVWGPGDRHIIPWILTRAKSVRSRRIGKENRLIDTTYIDNCVLAHICATKAIKENPKVAGKSYFISNGESLPM